MQVVFLFLLSGIHFALSLRHFNDLRTHYDINVTKNSFFELPQTTRSPLIQNYDKVQIDWHFPVNVYCYPKDPRVCLMYDYNGYVAGIQISFLFKDVKHVKNYDYEARGYVYSDILNTPAWAFRAYFTNPEKLTPAGRKNLCEVVEGVWVYLNNTLVHIPRKQPSPWQVKVGPFNRENCVNYAGNSYVYNIDSTVPCDEIFPFYFFYHKGSLSGFGVAAYGKGSTAKMDWYEHLSPETIEGFLPTHPTCMKEWMKKYGFPSVTIFLVDSPWEISCPSD